MLFEPGMTPKDFGAADDGVTDDTAAVGGFLSAVFDYVKSLESAASLQDLQTNSRDRSDKQDTEPESTTDPEALGEF